MFMKSVHEMNELKKQVIVVYDGDCLLCRQFKTYLTLKQRYALEVYDGRQHPEIVADLEQQGINCSAGMVIGIDGHYYVWADAIAQVHSLVAPEKRYDRAMMRCSRQPLLVAIVYPFIKLLRAVQLLAMWRSLQFAKRK
jgi:predicted DCC family thiol-disulfide oxidoreductase YuxK